MSKHIEQAPWSDFFTHFPELHQDYEARLIISGRSCDDREASAWLPLADMTYDPHHNRLCVAVGGRDSHPPGIGRHTVCTPMMVHVCHSPEGDISSILVVTPDMNELMVCLRRTPSDAASNARALSRKSSTIE